MTKCLDNINVKGLEKWILSFCLFAFLPFHASAIDVKGKKNSAVVDGISYQLNAKKMEQGLISSIEYQTATNNFLKAQADEMNSLLKYLIKQAVVRYYNGVEYINQ